MCFGTMKRTMNRRYQSPPLRWISSVSFWFHRHCFIEKRYCHGPVYEKKKRTMGKKPKTGRKEHEIKRKGEHAKVKNIIDDKMKIKLKTDTKGDDNGLKNVGTATQKSSNCSSNSEQEVTTVAPSNPTSWSKSKKKRMRKLFALQKKQGLEKQAVGKKTTRGNNDNKKKKIVKNNYDGMDMVTAEKEEDDDTETGKEMTASKSKLLDSFKARLTGSRFRILNEELYTTTSKSSFDRFTANPQLFEEYHAGFRHQVEGWPVNPVDTIYKWIVSNYKQKPRRSSDDDNDGNDDAVVVADFGCGDAQLAKDLINVKYKKRCPFTVHSFDLVSNGNSLVTACDMAHVPLEDKSVDVGVFCLALMGTNLADFIREAHRVLKDDGRIKIAEVRSRIEYVHSSNGTNKNHNNNNSHHQGKKQKNSKNNKSDKKNDQNKGTLDEFIYVLNELGFDCIQTNRSNKMFLLLELKKNGKQPNKNFSFSAKPCIYKRR